MVKKIESQGDLDAEIKSGKLVVVDFYADWCGPCKMIAPMIEEMEKEDANKDVVFCKVNVDESDDIAKTYGIEAMPTFFFFKNGEKVTSLRGANVQELKKLVAANR